MPELAASSRIGVDRHIIGGIQKGGICLSPCHQCVERVLLPDIATTEPMLAKQLDFSHRCCHQILITFTTKFWSGFDAVKGIDGTDGLRVGGMCFGGNAPTDYEGSGAFCRDYC